MQWKSASPGCPCCEDDCLIPIEGWEQWPSGPGSTGWTISADGTLITTPDTDALLTAEPDHPEDKSTHVVEVTVRGEDDGDILRVVVAFDTSDDYLYAEIEVGTVKGYLRLFQVVGGATFQLGNDVEVDDLGPAEDHAVKVCYDGEDLTVVLGTKASYLRAVTATGEYVGLATGAITTLASFKNFKWYIHYDDGGYYGEPNDCPKCIMSSVAPNGCGFCLDLITPQYIKATLAGLQNDDCNCVDLNGTYILTQLVGDYCVWTGWNLLPDAPCDSLIAYLWCTLTDPLGTGPFWQLQFSIGDLTLLGTQRITWAKNVLTPYDCMAVDEELDHVLTEPTPTYCLYDGSSKCQIEIP